MCAPDAHFQDNSPPPPRYVYLEVQLCGHTGQKPQNTAYMFTGKKNLHFKTYNWENEWKTRIYTENTQKSWQRQLLNERVHARGQMAPGGAF